MEDFGRARDERVRSGADGRKDSLRCKSGNKSDDGDDNEIRPFLTTNESENKENDESNGEGIDGATGKSKEESGGEKEGAG